MNIVRPSGRVITSIVITGSKQEDVINYINKSLCEQSQVKCANPPMKHVFSIITVLFFHYDVDETLLVHKNRTVTWQSYVCTTTDGPTVDMYNWIFEFLSLLLKVCPTTILLRKRDKIKVISIFKKLSYFCPNSLLCHFKNSSITVNV